MLEVISSFIVGVLERVAEAAFSKLNQENAIKRSCLAKLIEVYNEVEVLYLASCAVASEFNGIASGREAASRVVCFKRLKRIHDSFERLQTKVQDVTRVLKIYDPDLDFILSNTEHVKLSIWRRIILNEYLLPEMKTLDGKPSFIVCAPRKIPQNLRIIDPTITSDNIEAKVKEALQALQKDFDFIEVDIREMDESHPLIKDIDKSVESLKVAKSQLSSFIRDNYSLEELMKADAIIS